MLLFEVDCIVSRNQEVLQCLVLENVSAARGSVLSSTLEADLVWKAERDPHETGSLSGLAMRLIHRVVPLCVIRML